MNSKSKLSLIFEKLNRRKNRLLFTTQIFYLKGLAHLESDLSQFIAQITICDDLFELKNKDAERFSFVLVGNTYRTQAKNSGSKSQPLTYVQISSEYLPHAGIQKEEESLRYIVNTLGVAD